MKFAKSLLSLLLVLSLCLGFTVMTSAADTTEELTINRIVERADGGIDVHFSENVILAGRLFIGVCIVDGDNILTRFEREITSIEKGSVVSVTAENWGTTQAYTLMDHARRQILNNGTTYDRETCSVGLWIRDITTHTDDVYMDAITSEDGTKQLKATHNNPSILNYADGGADVYCSTDIEYAMPVLMGVDKVSNTQYTFNFSEDVAVADTTRLALRLLSKTSVNYAAFTAAGSVQQVVDAAGGFAYTVSGSAVTVTVPQTYVNKIQNSYIQTECQYAIHLQLIDQKSTDDPVRMNTITAVDDEAEAFACYNGADAADGVSWDVTDLMCPNAVIGDESYDTVADALAAAESGITVQLFRDNDCSGETLVVNAGVTLDLNRCDLTVDNLIAFGDVIDSVGGGVLKMAQSSTEAAFIVQEDNSMLPLYSSTLGGYRFFTYTFEGKETVTDSTALTAKYKVQLAFTDDTSGYTLLKNGQIQLGVALTLTRDGNEYTMTHYFKTSTMEAYADAMIAAPGEKCVVLTVSGLQDGDTLVANPIMETGGGYSLRGIKQSVEMADATA